MNHSHLYLAYGSNLHPRRLRLRAPSARLIGPVRLQGFRLCFHKIGQDGSGKCHLLETGELADHVHTALYTVSAFDVVELDDIEGNQRGYVREAVTIRHGGRRYRPYLYQAQAGHIDTTLQPFHWYKRLVGLGAAYHRFPRTYINGIMRRASVEDPDPVRRTTNARLIAQLRKGRRSRPRLCGRTTEA